MNTREQHLTFWRAMGKYIGGGTPIVQSLNETGEQVKGTPFGKVVKALAADIKEGQSLSQAMEKHKSVFTPSVLLMVRAGEAGGVLDVIVKRIVEGLQDGSFPVPRTKLAREQETVRAFRAFGRLLSSGVPILEAMSILGEEAQHKDMREALRACHDSIRSGGTMWEALRDCGQEIPKEVIAAVRAAEENGTLDECFFKIAEALENDDLASLVPSGSADVTGSQKAAEDAPIIKFVNLVLVQAVKDRASDIHFEPYEKEFKIRYRVDGVLYEMVPPPKAIQNAVINRLKIMAALDLAEKRLPQDGRIMIKVEGKELDLRVSTVPAIYGERVTMRILDRVAVCLDLERIGLCDDNLKTVRGLCQLPNGLVLCTGPVGSGKTTLLYAMLQQVNTPAQNVMSIEDPVEYILDGVSQIQVRPQIGLTFSRVMRSLLRQDPDVIMVGEFRDLETIQVSIQAVLTGHLVMSTLHTNDAPSALQRMLDIGVEPFLVNAATAGVIALRLVRKLCTECRRPAKPALHSLPPEVVDYIRQAGEKEFYAPPEAGKCKACAGTGYRGRTGIFEVLVPNEAVRETVASRAEPAVRYRAAVKAGMTPMLMDGVRKATQGITSIDEVLRVASRPPCG